MEVLATLNQTLLQDLTSYCQVFGGREHFRAYLPLLAFANNINLLNPSLDPVWITRQGVVEASTREGADASLLA